MCIKLDNFVYIFSKKITLYMFFSKKEKKKRKKDNFVYLLEFKKILSSF